MNKIFTYNNNAITFKKGENVMVNATEMAKPFGKSATHWLRNQSTQEFIEELGKLRNRNMDDLVIVTYGGNENGTWMHEDVAMEFARWLSPAFAIWCNDRIKELLTTGSVNMSELSRKQLAMMVIEAEEECERLMLDNKAKDEKIQADAPKVIFANAVETSRRSCLVGELAKILKQNGVNIGQNRLFEWLRENGYLCKKGECYNQPTQKSMELGLFEIKKQTISNPDGSVLVKTTTKVTGKGQIYFVGKFVSSKESNKAASLAAYLCISNHPCDVV